MQKMSPQFAKKFFAAYKKIQNPVKNAKNPFLKNSYANLDAVIDATKAALIENGLFMIQSCFPNESFLNVTTQVFDQSGQCASVHVSVFLKEMTPQGSMGAFTYGRRYGIKAMFNLSDDDDDGNTASGKSEPLDAPVNVEQKSPEQAVKGIAAILNKQKDNKQ